MFFLSFVQHAAHQNLNKRSVCVCIINIDKSILHKWNILHHARSSGQLFNTVNMALCRMPFSHNELCYRLTLAFAELVSLKDWSVNWS